MLTPCSCRYLTLVSPLQEPQKLVDDGAQVQLLGGHQRKAGCEIEAHLIAEYAQGAGAGAVVLARAVLADVAQKIEILPHYAFTRPNCRSAASRR